VAGGRRAADGERAAGEREVDTERREVAKE